MSSSFCIVGYLFCAIILHKFVFSLSNWRRTFVYHVEDLGWLKGLKRLKLLYQQVGFDTCDKLT